jgi:Tol biopolymer transport system component
MKASKGKQMRPLVIALAASLVLAVAACGGNDGAKSAGPVATVTLPAEPATPAASTATVSAAPEVDYVLDLDTGEITPLPEAIIRSELGNSRGYAASSDGSRLAYVRTADDGSSRQIFVAGIDGTGVRQVTHEPNGAAAPAWSPDGTMIAYLRQDGYFYRGRLAVVDLATGETRQISDEDFLYYSDPSISTPQFTPDGSSLFYTAYGSGLSTVPVAGGESTLLIGPDGGAGLNGSLSPDGSLVTYLAGGLVDGGRCGPCRVVANVDNTDRRKIPSSCFTTNPAGTWSPDGSRIVCIDHLGNDVTVLDVTTGLGSVVAAGSAAIWLDDHTLLVDV